MNNIDILEELKEFFDKMDYEVIKHKPEEYIKAISNLIAENKELKEENNELEVINKIQEYRISVIDERELIPKSKVEEEIKEVDIQLQKLKDELTSRKTNFVNKNMLFAQKEVLQSLLGKE